MVTKGADGGLNGAVDTPFAVAQTRFGPEDAPGPDRCSNHVCLSLKIGQWTDLQDEADDGQNDDNQSDKINDAVHKKPPLANRKQDLTRSRALRLWGQR